MTSNDRALKPLPKTGENRKLPKPLIEKKRRARINKSLTELKSLIGDMLRKEMQTTRRKRKSGKVEKADVLELTVKYIREVKNINYNLKNMASSGFYKGFLACLQEVKIFLENNHQNHDYQNSTNSEILISSLLTRLQHSCSQIKSPSSNSVTCSVIRHTNSLQNQETSDTNLWRPW